MKPKGDTSPSTRLDRPDARPPRPDGKLGRWIAGLTMAALAAVAFVISYSNGLYLVRFAGASGRLAYLYPLLPDALIGISWVSIYEAQRGGHSRTRWAIVGIVSGACLTAAMNLGAGVLHGWMDALVDGVVPLVFFIALEILMGLVRRGRGAPSPDAPDGGVPVTPGQQQTARPPTTDEALGVLLATSSRRLLAEDLGVTKARVETWAARVATPSEVSAAAAPEPSLNGNGASPS